MVAHNHSPWLSWPTSHCGNTTDPLLQIVIHSLSIPFPLLHVLRPLYYKPLDPRESLSLSLTLTHTDSQKPTMASSIALRRVPVATLLSKLFNPIHSISVAPSLSRSFNTYTNSDDDDNSDSLRGTCFSSGSCYLSPRFSK